MTSLIVAVVLTSIFPIMFLIEDIEDAIEDRKRNKR